MVSDAELLEQMKNHLATKIKDKPVARLSGKEIQQLPYICGFCNVGFHFRSKRPVGPVCKFIYRIPRIQPVVCMCDCTKTERDFQAMLRANGKDITTDSEPAPILPPPSARASLGVDMRTAPDAVTADPNAPDDGTMEIRTGSGGRIEKGELERAVFEVCLDGLNGNTPVPAAGMTVTWIVFEIMLRTGSTVQVYPGAVAAVLDRWSKIMWCTVEEKPLRLVDMMHQLKQVGPTKIREDIAGAQRRIMRGH